jgi:hypothetical protein
MMHLFQSRFNDDEVIIAKLMIEVVNDGVSVAFSEAEATEILQTIAATSEEMMLSEGVIYKI